MKTNNLLMFWMVFEMLQILFFFLVISLFLIYISSTWVAYPFGARLKTSHLLVRKGADFKTSHLVVTKKNVGNIFFYNIFDI